MGYAVPLEFTIYANRANHIRLALTENSKVIDHRPITRVAVYVNATLFDSQTQPTLFDISRADYLVIKLAGQAIPPGRHPAKLIIYDANELAAGFVWPETFVVNMAVEPF